MSPLVTYGLLALCLALFVFGFWLEGEKRAGSRLERWRRVGWIVQSLAVLAAYGVLRPGRGTHDPQADVRTAKNDHAPVFLDFYSNY